MILYRSYFAISDEEKIIYSTEFEEPSIYISDLQLSHTGEELKLLLEDYRRLDELIKLLKRGDYNEKY